MKKFKILILYPLQYLLFLKIYFFLKLLPINYASYLGGKVFKIFGPFTKTHKTVRKNISHAYNKNIEKNISIIAKNSWENLGKTVAELSHLVKIIKNKNLIKINGIENLNEVINNKEQAIFIAIHQSNWEILAPTLINFGIKINSVYRHINNSHIDKFILNIRQKAYQTNISQNNKSILSPKGKKSAQDMIKSIKNGYSIALLIDQKDSSGIDIPLFDIPAKTQVGFLKLAKKFNLKIYPIENTRYENLNFEITIHKPLNFINTKKENDENKIMYKIHKIIEEWIKKQPENWLWHHKRWG